MRQKILAGVSYLTCKSLALPIANLLVTTRCNCKCVMCDYWCSTDPEVMQPEDYGRLARELAELGTRIVVITGGEPLVRSDLFDLAAEVREHVARLVLVTNGIGVEPEVDRIAERFDELVVSLDSHRPEKHDAFRGAEAFDRVVSGIKAIKAQSPETAVHIRTVVHRHNFMDLPALVELAVSLEADDISFLPVDLATAAFGRGESPEGQSLAQELTLEPESIHRFEQVIEQVRSECSEELRRGFLRTSLRELASFCAHFREPVPAAQGPHRPKRCLAPFVSVVVEDRGRVRPCYFLDPIGDPRSESMASILRSDRFRELRRDVRRGRFWQCSKCVSPVWRAPWRMLRGQPGRRR